MRPRNGRGLPDSMAVSAINTIGLRLSHCKIQMVSALVDNFRLALTLDSASAIRLAC